MGINRQVCAYCSYNSVYDLNEVVLIIDVGFMNPTEGWKTSSMASISVCCTQSAFTPIALFCSLRVYQKQWHLFTVVCL